MSKTLKKKINCIKRFYTDVYKVDSDLKSELKKMDTDQAKKYQHENGRLVINFDDHIYQNNQVMEPEMSIIENRPIHEYRRLTRGISSASGNDDLAWVLSDDCEPLDTQDDAIFLLPDISIYPDDFRKFLEKDLLDNTTLSALESAGRVNWWSSSNSAGGESTRLLALWTRGDGSCAAHAARLAARGVHDRRLALRRALHAVLAADNGSSEKDKHVVRSIQRRWRHALSEELTSAGAHHLHSDENDSGEPWWHSEWDSVVRRARRAADALEPVHLLALAHAIKRPIVVYADTILKDLAGLPLAPIPFGGVFLPLELEPEECSTSPVLLAYHAGHFSALVPSAPSVEIGGGCQTFVLPLHDSSGLTMPVHFTIDPGEEKPPPPYEAKTSPQSLKPPKPPRKHRNAATPTEQPPSIVHDSKTMQMDKDLALIFKYLDIVELPSDIGVPERSFRHSMDELSNSSGKSTKNKHFGSIGRSFGSRLKNFGRKTDGKGKLEKRLSISSDGTLLSAANGSDARLWFRVKAARSAIQDEMIKNYLNDALRRYHCATLPQSKCDDLYPTLRYGTGRSRFYAETERIPQDGTRKGKKSTKCAKSNSMRPLDRTMYLSKSTFYDDRPIVETESSNL